MGQTAHDLRIEYIDVDALVPYERNARKHAEEDISAIVASIREFGFNDPIGVWKGNVIIEGHGRLMAAKQLGMTKVPVIYLDHMTDEQRRAYALAHNRTAELSAWDNLLRDEELADIYDIDMSAFGFFDLEEPKYDDGKKGALVENFGVPPFSVLDTRQGYWRKRKEEWLKITGNLSETRDGEFGVLSGGALLKTINGGTSNFDPVLAEIMYKWFCVDGGGNP